MADRNDVKSTNLTSTDTVAAGPSRLRAVWNGATAGALVVRDGGAGGTTVLTLTLGANQTYDLPGAGIRCETDCHATLTTANDVTFIYEG